MKSRESLYVVFVCSHKNKIFPDGLVWCLSGMLFPRNDANPSSQLFIASHPLPVAQIIHTSSTTLLTQGDCDIHSLGSVSALLVQNLSEWNMEMYISQKKKEKKNNKTEQKSLVGAHLDVFNSCYFCALPAHLPQFFLFYRPYMIKNMQRRSCITVHFIIICSCGLGN